MGAGWGDVFIRPGPGRAAPGPRPHTCQLCPEEEEPRAPPASTWPSPCPAPLHLPSWPWKPCCQGKRRSKLCTRRGLGRPPPGSSLSVGPAGSFPCWAARPVRLGRTRLWPPWPSSSGPGSGLPEAAPVPCLSALQGQVRTSCDCQPEPGEALPSDCRLGHQRPAASSGDTQSPAVLLGEARGHRAAPGTRHQQGQAQGGPDGCVSQAASRGPPPLPGGSNASSPVLGGGGRVGGRE